MRRKVDNGVDSVSLLIERFGEFARGGDGIVMVVTPQGKSNHVIAVVRGRYTLEDMDDISVELRALAVPVKSPFMKKR